MGELSNAFPTLLAETTSAPEGSSYWGMVAYVVFTLVVIFVAIALAKKGLGERVFKNPVTQLAEQMYLFIESMCVNTIGRHGRKYIPIIGTFWLVIFFGNTISLFFANAPTAELSLTSLWR